MHLGNKMAKSNWQKSCWLVRTFNEIQNIKTMKWQFVYVPTGKYIQLLFIEVMIFPNAYNEHVVLIETLFVVGILLFCFRFFLLSLCFTVYFVDCWFMLCAVRFFFRFAFLPVHVNACFFFLPQFWFECVKQQYLTLCRHNSIVERLNFYLIACRRCRCRVCHIIIILSLSPSHFPIHFCVPSRQLGI